VSALKAACDAARSTSSVGPSSVSENDAAPAATVAEDAAAADADALAGHEYGRANPRHVASAAAKTMRGSVSAAATVHAVTLAAAALATASGRQARSMRARVALTTNCERGWGVGKGQSKFKHISLTNNAKALNSTRRLTLRIVERMTPLLMTTTTSS